MKTGGWGWGGDERSGAALDTGILLSAFTNIYSLKRSAFFKWCRFKHQIVKVLVFYAPSFVKTRKMGSIKANGGRGGSGIINYSVCETS